MSGHKIYYNNSEFTPSSYQEAIFENILHGSSNMVINAVAGSGKSTTIVNALRLIPSKNRVLFIAFNKDIVETLKNKVGEVPNVNIMTYHSLGYSIVMEALKEKPELDEYKYMSYVRSNLSNLGYEHNSITGSLFSSFLKNIEKLIDYARFNLCQSEREIEEIAEKYGVMLVANECEIVENTLKWGKNSLKTVDYTDMVWLPYELDLKPKKHVYDWIFVDEAQDSSPVQQNLFLKCFRRGARFCAVGDSSQCINAWAGADVDAFKNFLKIPNTKEFPLPISYRCPKSVITMAQKYVPEIQATDDAIMGEIKYDVDPYSPKPGDMVLCRTTYPLVKLYAEYLRINKKSYIRGKDIGENLIETINQFKGLGVVPLNKSLMGEGLFRDLYKHFFKIVENMMEKCGLSEEEAYFSVPAMEFYDTISSLEILSEGINDADELIDKIRTIFNEGNNDAVCLSTVHKSKGLEADNVYILCKSQMPSIYATKEWEIISERNLEYVAITRTKKSLQYIDEDKFRVERGNKHNTDIKKKLNIVRDLLKLPVRRKINVTIKRSGITSNLGTKIGQPKKENRKPIGALKFNKFLKK